MIYGRDGPLWKKSQVRIGRSEIRLARTYSFDGNTRGTLTEACGEEKAERKSDVANQHEPIIGLSPARYRCASSDYAILSAMKRRALPSLAFVVCLAFPVASDKLPANEPALLYSSRMPRRVIIEILREQAEAWNRGDGVAWAKDFTDDCDFVNLRGDILHGRADIGTSVAASLQGGLKGSHLSLTLRQFNLLTPDIGLVDTDYDLTGIQGVLPGVAVTDGVLQTRLQYVAIRRGQHWHFIAAQNTVVLPAPPKP
jgi:uncharacterized protein (TIGR02246 family)